MSATLLVHATSVAIGGRAVLLRGPSGLGKSDLALRLIDAGADLVSDDQSILERRGNTIVVRAPPTIAGLIEVAASALCASTWTAEATLALVTDLVAPGSGGAPARAAI